jgi:hypothetical protein
MLDDNAINNPTLWTFHEGLDRGILLGRVATTPPSNAAMLAPVGSGSECWFEWQKLLLLGESDVTPVQDDDRSLIKFHRALDSRHIPDDCIPSQCR